MRILWSANTIMPRIASEFGVGSGHAISWIDAMSQRLAINENVELAIVSGANVKLPQKKTIDNVVYYIVPKDWDKVNYWDEIVKDFKPDVAHLYGTENRHNLLFIQSYPSIPIIVSLQGILTEYIRHFDAGIGYWTRVKYTTLKDLFFPTGFFSEAKLMKKRSKYEREILSQVKNVEGRSTWDRVSAMNINSNLNYYFCPRMIRRPFFDAKWDVNKIEKHSIYISQGYSPEKGLHYLFEAVAKLKNRYPDIKIYVSGIDKLHSSSLKSKWFPSGYIKYLRDLMLKNGITDNVCFTGKLSADGVASYLMKVHVAVIASSIENAPNSLAEAMVVGTPTIASFVGGNMDMSIHKETGFLYTYNEPNMLAEYIRQIFESNDLANTFSLNARKLARSVHDPETLENTLLNIYKTLLNN